MEYRNVIIYLVLYGLYWYFFKRKKKVEAVPQQNFDTEISQQSEKDKIEKYFPSKQEAKPTYSMKDQYQKQDFPKANKSSKRPEEGARSTTDFNPYDYKAKNIKDVEIEVNESRFASFAIKPKKNKVRRQLIGSNKKLKDAFVLNEVLKRKFTI